jgi:hypothetical protein
LPSETSDPLRRMRTGAHIRSCAMRSTASIARSVGQPTQRHDLAAVRLASGQAGGNHLLLQCGTSRRQAPIRRRVNHRGIIMPQNRSLGILPSLVLVTLIIALIGSLHRVSHLLEGPLPAVTGTISTAHLK